MVKKLPKKKSDILTKERVTWLSVMDGQCRYPIGEGRHSHPCGEKTHNHVYCSKHRELTTDMSRPIDNRIRIHKYMR